MIDEAFENEMRKKTKDNKVSTADLYWYVKILQDEIKEWEEFWKNMFEKEKKLAVLEHYLQYIHKE